MMSIGSDKNDKFAQPDGRFVGAPGKPTGVGYDASELRGCKRVVLDGLDHREVAFHKLAFAAMYEFIAGRPPGTLFIAQEPNPVLNGRVTGIADDVYTNLPVTDARSRSTRSIPRPANAGPIAAHRKTTGPDGHWGPFTARADVYYEFVVTVAGQPITHTYRSPFLRSSDVVHLRPGQFAKGDETGGRRRHHEPAARLFRLRPRQVHARRQGATGINEGVPGISTGQARLRARRARR